MGKKKRSKSSTKSRNASASRPAPKEEPKKVPDQIEEDLFDFGDDGECSKCFCIEEVTGSGTCNHVYCTDCWKEYFEDACFGTETRSSLLQGKLTCIAEECSQTVPLSVFAKHGSRTVEEVKDMTGDRNASTGFTATSTEFVVSADHGTEQNNEEDSKESLVPEKSPPPLEDDAKEDGEKSSKKKKKKKKAKDGSDSQKKRKRRARKRKISNKMDRLSSCSERHLAGVCTAMNAGRTRREDVPGEPSFEIHVQSSVELSVNFS